METYVVQFPSRAFAHIAPPWSQSLHGSPNPFLRFRAVHSSDDLMLTDSDLELASRVGFDDEADARRAHPGQR